MFKSEREQRESEQENRGLKQNGNKEVIVRTGEQRFKAEREQRGQSQNRRTEV